MPEVARRRLRRRRHRSARKSPEERVRVPGRPCRPVRDGLDEREIESLESRGRIEVHMLVEIVRRLVVALGAEGLHRLMLRRIEREADLETECGDAAEDEAVLIAPNE